MSEITSRFAALLFSAALLSSCTTMVFVQKPVEPEIEISGEGNRMVVQNYFDYTRDDFVKDRNEEVYNAAVSSFTKALVNDLAGEKLIIALEGDTLVRSDRRRLPTDMLSSEEVSGSCSRFGANLLLSIDSVYVGFDWEMERYEDEDGSVSKTKYFYIEVQPYLSLYDSEGGLIDRSYVYRRMLYKSRIALSGLITIAPSLSKAVEEVIITSGDAAIDYGAKFFNTMESYPYKVYYSQPFTESYMMMTNGYWAEAIRSLLPLAESSDPKVAKKAANNLYVAYTGIGDDTSAEIWRKRAEK